MDAEIDILEPVDNWEKTLFKQASLRKLSVPVQNIMVNGQEQTIYGEAYCLACPVCNSVVWQFQTGVSAIDIVKSLCTDNEEEYNKAVFCRTCGQKLRIMRPQPIEQVNEEGGDV